MSFSSTDIPLEVFSLLVDQSPDAVVFANRQGKIQVWNKAAINLFGFTPGEVIGRTLDVIIPKHLRQAHWTGFERAVAFGHTKHGSRAMKTRANQKTGHKLYVSLAFSIIHDPDGNVIGAMATARGLIEEPKTQQPNSEQSTRSDCQPLDRNSDS